LGYDHLACPWDNTNGIIAQAKAAKKAETLGVLATIWNHYMGHNLANIYVTTSSMAWNTDATPPTGLNRFKTHFREVGWDSKLKKYRQFGIFHTQVPPRLITTQKDSKKKFLQLKRESNNAQERFCKYYR
jgi:hypothetical protein